MVSLKIKWNKENYDNVAFDPSSGVDGLKTIVYNLTHVPKDRQKLMAKGVWTATLKDDFDFTNCAGLKDGVVVLVMGTAEVVVAPVQQTTFIEDMTTEQKALAGATMPAGLVNLGNTCYLNSVLQSFRYLPELRSTLNSEKSLPGLVASLRDLFNQLDRSSTGVPPFPFLGALRGAYPIFGATGEGGRPLQQDAEEAFGALMTSMKTALPTKVHDIFEIEIEEQLHCTESTEEAVVTKHDTLNKLVCNIRGGSGATVNIDHMIEGLRLGLEDTVEKHSSVLQRDALWMKKQRMNSLPKYLSIQFMRFFWKATPESADHAGVKCKIMRSVTFPRVSITYDKRYFVIFNFFFFFVVARCI
jgi:ubiquitin carboxyl-terminal hydrolase 14